MQALNIIIADDHPLFRGALKQAIEGIAEETSIIEAGDFDAALTAADCHPEADLILLDLSMPGISGFSGLTEMRSRHPSLPVVVVSATDDCGTVRRAIDIGASGFISKSSGIDDIRCGIHTVLDGDVWAPQADEAGSGAASGVNELVDRLKTLTPQQNRVLAMLAQGLLNKQIAYQLQVSEATVKAHVSAILLKLKVDSRTQAVIQLGKLNPVMAA